MAETAGRLRYYVDESLLGLGKILARARSDVVHPGHPDFPEVTVGTPDPVWMPIVARLGLVVLVRDKRIRRKPVELALFQQSGLRAFGLAGAKDLNNWGYLELVVRHWARVESIIDARGPGRGSFHSSTVERRRFPFQDRDDGRALLVSP